MAQAYVGQKRVRRYYGKIREVLEMPNLIEVQKSSYDLFLRSGEGDKPLDDEGIQGTFQSVFPIRDFNETAVLEFVKYELEKPKYDVDECMQRDLTYAAPLKVTLRLIVFDVDEATGARSVKDIKEQDVYMGDMPLMTTNGTFIVNGTERVIVSQMHRSPGVFFDHDKGKSHSSGKLLFACRIIPYRGSWLDFEFDAKDVVYARIDRRRSRISPPKQRLAVDLGDDAAVDGRIARDDPGLGRVYPLGGGRFGRRRALVSGGDGEQHAAVGRRDDGAAQGVGNVPLPAKRHVDDARAVGDGVVDGADQVRVVEGAVLVRPGAEGIGGGHVHGASPPFLE